jgi:hypothetical protein
LFSLSSSHVLAPSSHASSFGFGPCAQLAMIRGDEDDDEDFGEEEEEEEEDE